MRARRQVEPADLITNAEAAKLLGFSLLTARRQDENGKFSARRHPITSYSMYTRDDAMKLWKKIVEGERAAQS